MSCVLSSYVTTSSLPQCACAVNTGALFAAEQPKFESQYWHSMSTLLTRLDLEIEDHKLTEALCEDLCQLSKLQHLEILAHMYHPAQPEIDAFVHLNLPLLQHLDVANFGPASVRLSCPRLSELVMEYQTMKSFSGMPANIQEVSLSLGRASASLKEIFPVHSGKFLEDLEIDELREGLADPETVKELCLNGKLRWLKITYYDAAPGAFSMDASWQAIPETLQFVTLDIPLDEGIPPILEQLVSLRALSLTHNRNSRMHLDRPLDPFLDMPMLRQLQLHSDWQSTRAAGTGMCMWTPASLGLLGLARKRILQMRLTPAGRSIILSP